MIKIFKILFLISAVLSVGLLLASSQAVRYDCFAVQEQTNRPRLLKRVRVIDYKSLFIAEIDNKEYFSGLLREAVINDQDVSINTRNGIDYLRTYFDNDRPAYIMMRGDKRLYITHCRTKEQTNENSN